MKRLYLIVLLILAFTAGAQTPAQRDSAKRDSAHRQYPAVRDVPPDHLELEIY